MRAPDPDRGPRSCSDGVSRLSAHLHFGMVSPFRVAREALAAGTYSANKFVDEFLTWREVAYAFCFHHSADLETLQARRPHAVTSFGAALCAHAVRQCLHGQHQHVDHWFGLSVREQTELTHTMHSASACHGG